MLTRFNKKPKRIKRDYQSRSLSNPFFRPAPKKLNTKLKTFFYLLGLVLLGLFIWFFYASPVWQIKHIKVEGLTRFSETEIIDLVNEQMAKKTKLFFRQTNIHLFKSDDFKEEIIASYNFSDLKIIKQIPQTLVLKIKERPYAFIFKQGEEVYYASSEAYLIPEAEVREEDLGRYFILENQSDREMISANRIKISQEYLDFMFSLNDFLKISQGVKIDKFIIDLELNTLKADCQEGPLVYFNINDSAQDQLERLIIIKDEKIKENFSNTNYIDLRYGDKIYIN